MNRMARIFTRTMHDRELLLLRNCEMSEAEAQQFIKRFKCIAYFVGCPLYDIVSLYHKVYSQGSAEREDMLCLMYYGISLKRDFPELFHDNETTVKVTYQQFKLFIISLTNKDGIFYREKYGI